MTLMTLMTLICLQFLVAKREGMRAMPARTDSTRRKFTPGDRTGVVRAARVHPRAGLDEHSARGATV
jgi:hypothetical protein